MSDKINAVPSLWAFVEYSYRSWTWSRLWDNGTVAATSHTFPDYGKALGDAMTHGFSPKTQTWKLTSRHGRTTTYVGRHTGAATNVQTASRRPGQVRKPRT